MWTQILHILLRLSSRNFCHSLRDIHHESSTLGMKVTLWIWCIIWNKKGMSVSERSTRAAVLNLLSIPRHLLFSSMIGMYKNRGSIETAIHDTTNICFREGASNDHCGRNDHRALHITKIKIIPQIITTVRIAGITGDFFFAIRVERTITNQKIIIEKNKMTFIVAETESRRDISLMLIWQRKKVYYFLSEWKYNNNELLYMRNKVDFNHFIITLCKVGSIF